MHYGLFSDYYFILPNPTELVNPKHYIMLYCIQPCHSEVQRGISTHSHKYALYLTSVCDMLKLSAA